MAYDQSYYQAPQGSYAGRPAQRPGPPQGYNHPPPPQQYPPEQYDQYPQDDYYDDYNNGYAQDYGYQDMNGGGRGNGYPLPDQGYPPQQQYYGNDRGGGMPPPRGGRGGPPMQRPPAAGSAMRGGFGPGPGRGYPNGGPPPGRGGRPDQLERSASSDPGCEQNIPPLLTIILIII
jgi:hypothetical protein